MLHHTLAARIMSPTVKTTWTSLLCANIMSRYHVKVCRRRAGHLDVGQMGAEKCVVPAPCLAWSLDLIAVSDLVSVNSQTHVCFGLFIASLCSCCYDPSLAKEIRIL